MNELAVLMKNGIDEKTIGVHHYLTGQYAILYKD
jgi:hypothetical protein